MENISAVVRHLRKELERAKREVERYGAALVALNGAKYGKRTGRRALSAAARKRISARQKARWRAWRKAQKVKP